MSTSAAMLAASTASSWPGACPFATCGVVARAGTPGRAVQGFLSSRLAYGTALPYHWAQTFFFFCRGLIKQEHRTMSMEQSVTRDPSLWFPVSLAQRLRSAGGGGWGHAHLRGCSVFTGLCNVTTGSSRTFSSPQREPWARKRSLPPLTAPVSSLIPVLMDPPVLTSRETEPCVTGLLSLAPFTPQACEARPCGSACQYVAPLGG